MTTHKKLAVAALAGLFTAGLMASSPAFADNHDKAACSGASGCKGKSEVQKTECKGKTACKTADGTEKHACKGHEHEGKNECKAKTACKTETE